ncbi:hypothetical protein [Paenibacillus cucumis (ex Kampfer et al. 2016)]|uniref:Uncharacterized protein n=1 Tax=Paenibacillus cucumis (ex Kampfer et al. 2016) TaxID=1776858 RepID=A0ABS7KKH9_9BACL|nr:hypothetical protein [Paenibacillus cucumis (ex Kampfer et al. 2016)]MBY0204670.1 hypothetical protein [Paenibacillus cucumis (ex Kampfer et al. 2016)]
MGLNLYYKDHINWVPIPEWSRFFIKLGELLADRCNENKRWTAALALPTTDYVAPFVGLGILTSIVSKSSSDELVEAHFQMLASLERYTFVWYRKNKRLLKANFLGIADFEGEQRLLIQTQSINAGGLTEYISKKDALDIQISTNKSSRLPKNQLGRTVITEFPLADAVFGLHSRELLKQSETKLCFVGRREQLESETTKTVISIPKENLFLKGTLNELLRIRQFQHTVDSYQSQFLSSQAKKNENEIYLSDGPIMIYSGSNGYLNWKEDFLCLNSVVILDRSEPQFVYAIEEINNRYIEVNRMTTSNLDLGIVPGGIELLFWEEEVR